MMKIAMFEMISPLQSKKNNSRSNKFLEELKKNLNREIVTFNSPDLLKEYSFSEDCFPIFFIKSGGTEVKFKELYENLNYPFYFLLSTNSDNSLAASLEISAFLRERNKKVFIFHGDAGTIAKEIIKYEKIVETKIKLKASKFGVIGSPSEWLIGSEINYSKLKEKLGISLIDIEMSELVKEINDATSENRTPYRDDLIKKSYDKNTLENALKIYNGLKKIVLKKGLNGVTVRCFDLLKIFKNTGCIGLSLLNSEDIIAGCEGDIPTFVTMVIINYLTGEPSFMANPSSIISEKNEVVLAHCSVPLKMLDNFSLDTHFESGIGVGIKGELTKGEATILKISNNLTNYFISQGKILDNLNNSNLCRTQIRMQLKENVNYFLKNSLGNHHVVCKGNQKDILKEFLELHNMKSV